MTIQAQILELMKELQRDEGTAIIMITHDLGVIANVCDRVSVMYAGRFVEEAPVDELFAQPRPSLHDWPAAVGAAVGRGGRWALRPDSGPTARSHVAGRRLSVRAAV
ncbi:MAG: hypothetical protein R3C10_10170 [Pirellulales bacterium]